MVYREQVGTSVERLTTEHATVSAFEGRRAENSRGGSCESVEMVSSEQMVGGN